MELRHLEYFKAVAEELHFRKAAEKLYITQPPLTRQIKQLEEELGVTLFERNNKRVRLTPAGLYLKEEVDKLFQDVSTIKLVMAQYGKGQGGELKIGFVSSTLFSKISELLVQLKTAFPHLKTRLYEVPTVKQIDAIEHGRLDIGILRTPVYSDLLTLVPLFKDDFVFVISKNEASMKAFSLAQYSDAPFIFFNKDYANAYFNQLLEICQRHGFRPDVVHEANNVHTIIRMVEEGLGVSILPSSVAAQYSRYEVHFEPINEIQIQTEVVIAYRKGNDSQFINKMVELMQKAYQS